MPVTLLGRRYETFGSQALSDAVLAALPFGTKACLMANHVRQLRHLFLPEFSALCHPHMPRGVLGLVRVPCWMLILCLRSECECKCPDSCLQGMVAYSSSLDKAFGLATAVEQLARQYIIVIWTWARIGQLFHPQIPPPAPRRPAVATLAAWRVLLAPISAANADRCVHSSVTPDSPLLAWA